MVVGSDGDPWDEDELEEYEEGYFEGYGEGYGIELSSGDETVLHMYEEEPWEVVEEEEEEEEEEGKDGEYAQGYGEGHEEGHDVEVSREDRSDPHLGSGPTKDEL